jgi:antitoxin VapB
MALNIKSEEADRLVRELVALTGEGITEAVTKAVSERLETERARAGHDGARRAALKAELRLIRERASKLPVLDHRSDDELLGYNDIGTFD